MKTKMLIFTLTLAAMLGLNSYLHAQFGPSCYPLDSLMAFWPLDTTHNGNTISGGYTGTVFGPIHTTDRYGFTNKAYKFDGLNDYILTGYAGILKSAPRAVSFWARVRNNYVNVVAGNGMYPVAWGSNGTGDRFGCSLDFPANRPAIGGGFCYQSYATCSIRDNTWHHYVFQYRGTSPSDFTTVEVYYDGNLISSTGAPSSGAGNIVNTLNSGAFNVHFGKTNFGTPSFFEGDLDDVGIWGRTLTDCEIKKIYNCNDCCGCDGERRGAAKGTGSIIPADNLPTSGHTVFLDQNVPNPFTESTMITYTLPQNYTKAEMIFTNNQGQLVKTISLNGKGEGRLNVMANDLSHGIYSYSLVVDGRILDSKKMIKE
jgi:hypothetical protein